MAFAAKSPYMTVETMLGSWTFHREEVAGGANSLTRTFKPFKGTRKFWKRANVAVVLPAILTEGRGPLDGLAKAHLITVREPLNNQKGVWIETGYGCPWCGAWYIARYWDQRAGRCALCRVQSEK